MGRANALLAVLLPLAVACGREPKDNGSVELNAEVQDCPIVQTLTAIQPTANTTAPGNTSTIYASAAAPDSKTLVYKFSIKSGTGTLSHQAHASNHVGTSSSIVFTCPDKAEVATIELATSDEKGRTTCPASLATATVKVTCEASP